MPAVLAMPHIESLLVDIISGGAVLASGDFAKQLLAHADQMYLRDYPDVAESIKFGGFESVMAHWDAFGVDEDGRYHAIHSIKYEAVEQAVYDMLLGPRVTHETAAFRYENSLIQTWVAGVN